MPKLSLLLLCLIASLHLHAQAKKIKVKDEHLKHTYEVFTVLEYNPDVKEGPYKRVVQGKLAVEGMYHENRRGGLWTWYNGDEEPGCMVNYNTGIVHYYVRNGFFLNWYDESIVYEKDRSVILLTSEDVRNDVIAKNLRYPDYARKNNLQGRVVIGITVNPMGNITGYKVATSMDSSLDNAALNIAKLIPLDFIPAYKNGHAVTDEYLLPVGFELR
ncbi:MAG: energy transducer TonB [Bacteroidetes bacterium]|nr:energy transducer TonB [Bacteroidota bacterium]